MPTASAKRKKRKRSVIAAESAPVIALSPKAPAQNEAVDPFNFSSVVWRQRVAPAILLILVTFALYIQVIHHPFANYDDGEYVQQNGQIQHGISLRMLRWAFTSTEHENWHPVTWISHTVDWTLFGPSPIGHHVMSLLVHIVTVVLLFLFLAEMTGATGRSLLVALLFSIHPVSVESVVWIAERKNVLCTLFFFAALLAYSGYARRPRIARYLVVAFLFALSLASKPMTVTFPFVLLLMDFWPLNRIEGWTKPSPDKPVPQFKFSRLVLEKLPLLLLSVGDSVVTVVAQRGAIRAVAKFPFHLRLENAVVSYASYLWNTVWPTRLSVLYPYPSHGLPWWKILLSAAILVAGTFIAWRRRSHGYLLVGWCWFLGTLIPVIGLVQVGEQAMADRYAYLPLVGIYIIAVWGLVDAAKEASKESRSLIAVASGACLLFLASTAYTQVHYWRSNIDLWKHAVSVTDANSGAEDVIGSELLVEAINSGQRYSDEARAHFQKALLLDPNDSRALFSLAMDLRGRGRPAEALEKYKTALEYAGDNSLKGEILSGIATCYEMMGDFPTARDYYQQALNISPGPDNDSFVGFARTFTDEKIVKVAAELRDHPTAQGYWQLGQLQEAAARVDDAKRSYQKALELDTNFAPAQAALVNLHPGATGLHIK
jgi:protein O-mannosyl-transferase